MRQAQQPPRGTATAAAAAAGVGSVRPSGGGSAKPRFSWQQNDVQLAAAPWVQDRERQRFVTASVTVVEESAPQYALTFTATAQLHGPRSQPARVVRKVTKQHMASAFERAVSAHSTHGFAQLRTRSMGSSHGNSSYSKKREPKRDIDDAVHQWLLQGQAAPAREEIVLWLLSRMILVSTTTASENREAERAWNLLICGEQGAEHPIAAAAALSASPHKQEQREDDSEQEAEDDELPDYDDWKSEQHANESDDEEDGETSDTRASETFRSASGGDEHVAPEPQDPPASVAAAEAAEKPKHHRALPEATFKSVQQSLEASRVSSAASTAAASSSSSDLEPEDTGRKGSRRSSVHLQRTQSKIAPETQASVSGGHNSTSQFTFEPASTRIRRSQSDLENEWTQDRKSLQLELRKSRKDIQAAKELQRRTEVIAHLRKQQQLLQSQRKLRAHDQKREDSHKVSQLIADTLEYHELLSTLETQVKRTKISAKREQGRLTQAMRVALGRSEKHLKGPILGSGPLSQLEIAAACSVNTLGGGHEVDTFVYDLHGRRHSAEDARDIVALGVFESAMLKIKRIFVDRRGNNGNGDMLATFRLFDTNRSGTLSRDEFTSVLLANDIKLTGEQANVLFRHFDPNGSGEIDYGELLWGFFNRRAFLKKWQLRKTKLSAREIKLLFYQYDRTGRGALSTRDFQRAMDDIGFQLSEQELALLVLKFDVNQDGFIDYHEFHAFVSNGDDDEEEGEGKGRQDEEDTRVETGGKRGGDSTAIRQSPRRRPERRQSSSSSTRSQSQRHSGAKEEIDGDPKSIERILSELRALSATQAKIRQTVRQDTET